MADKINPKYVTMTSMEIMLRHQPDAFHLLLGGTDKRADNVEAKRNSVISEFKEKVLKDENGRKVFLQFIRENMKNCPDDQNARRRQWKKRKGCEVEELYSREQSTEDHPVDDIQSNDWFNSPFTAVEQNRLDILTICFRTGVDIANLFWKDCKNLLMHAVSQPIVREEMVTLLLQHLDINSEAVNGETALCVCLQNKLMAPDQKLWWTKFLLQHGAQVCGAGRILNSPLHMYVHSLTSPSKSIDENWKEIVDELVNASKGNEERDFLGQSPLMVAVLALPPSEVPEADACSNAIGSDNVTEGTTLKVIRYLLEKGADPNFADIRGNTCAHLVSLSGNVEALRLLLSYGCKAGAQNRIGMTPVYSSCAEIGWTSVDDVENVLFPILTELINAGCNINSKAIDMSTVLHYAAAKLPGEIVRFLCEMGANVSDTDYLGRTPLHMVSRNENPGLAHCLKEFGADPDAPSINAETPLHLACLLDNFEVATALIQLGANVEAVADFGIKPIHLSAENGSAELLKAIVSCAELDVTDVWGARPLHYAASDGNFLTVEIMLELGADRNMKDAGSRRPIDYACFRGNSLKTAQLLSDDEANVRFGTLPPLYFPNRPVIDKEEVGDYFHGLIEAFKKEGEKGVRLTRRLLNCPGLGHVELDSGEAETISTKIISMMERIVKRIGELDSVFEAKLLRAGSTLEEVKTGYPDEYDFLCDVVKFSRNIERTEGGETEGFARIIMKADAPPEILQYCLRSSRVLNAAFFQQHFTALARQAMYDILSEHNPQIYTGYMLITDNITLFDPLFYQKVKLHGQTMTFRGLEHKFLDISVDINPVLFSPILPTEFVQTCKLLGDLSSKGIYLIPKHCAQILTFPTENIPQSTDLWRYSTHHIEAEVMRTLPKIGRDC